MANRRQRRREKRQERKANQQMTVGGFTPQTSQAVVVHLMTHLLVRIKPTKHSFLEDSKLILKMRLAQLVSNT